MEPLYNNHKKIVVEKALRQGASEECGKSWNGGKDEDRKVNK